MENCRGRDWSACKGVSMRCITCKGIGILGHTLRGSYCPTVVCSDCRGSGMEKEANQKMEEFLDKQENKDIKVGDCIRYKGDNNKEYTGKIAHIEKSIGKGIVISFENGIKIGILDYIGKVEGISDELSKKQKEDMVNHPKHYTFGKIEVITVIDDWQLGFYEGQVIKYVGRAKHKGNELEDLKKSQWYLNRLIEQLEKEK